MKNSLLILCILLGIAFGWNACKQQPYGHGESLYKNFCANCHMETGEGLKGLIPPLAAADYLKNNQDQLACIIRHGMQGEIRVNGKTYDEMMLAVPELNDFEITNVINYINTSWGNNIEYMSIERVKTQLENCKPEANR